MNWSKENQYWTHFLEIQFRSFFPLPILTNSDYKACRKLLEIDLKYNHRIVKFFDYKMFQGDVKSEIFWHHYAKIEKAVKRTADGNP